MGRSLNVLNIYAGKTSSGNTKAEEVLVEDIDVNIYKLLSAPGLALNLAKGDIFKFFNSGEPVKVIHRGGNFNIHIYEANLTLEDYEDFKNELLDYLEGTIDGLSGNNMAITVPSTQGIQRVNSFFINFSEISGNSWAFTNIYKNYEDFDDETLLGWWDKKC
ncbi:DUF4265 domain-containing protein [Acinetobacter courvalinii]|uniref:DUF4265 domain-containing protein n=1 Tax=Acinetobacter courvalinii TaxID=280147 RepID=N9PVU3_9GAMM|nr:DUF4265 domain-containing protein [Acinetobacter courvalinii]ENX37584.1 hypothetical protein F888_02925 [Acinetobacter courvalinii]KAB0658925.1 DUF4265 domain-containing protein [Acinetobacter courvalinii]RSN81636.1 DUF4265 domain-containing protein [Acinetobacter baumannii]GGH26461.1 hypothetical protein GCM10007354_03930 [Acinetobacter courvalinii]